MTTPLTEMIGCPLDLLKDVGGQYSAEVTHAIPLKN